MMKSERDRAAEGLDLDMKACVEIHGRYDYAWRRKAAPDQREDADAGPGGTTRLGEMPTVTRPDLLHLHARNTRARAAIDKPVYRLRVAHALPLECRH